MTPKNKNKPRIFLFHGPDDYSIQKKIEQWINSFRNKYSRQGITKIDVSSQEGWLSLLRAAASSGGLFSSERLVIVKDLFQQKAEEHEKILGILADLPSEVFLVFWEKSGVRRSLRLYKKLQAWHEEGKAKIEFFEIPGGLKLNHFIERYCAEKKIKISPAAVEKLVVFLGRDLSERVKTGGGYEGKQVYNLWQATSELDKLAVYKSGKEISEKDVEALVSPKFSENVFLLVEALSRRDLSSFQKSLDELFSPGSSSTTDLTSRALSTLGALAYQFRSLLELYSAKEVAGSEGGVRSILGWSPYRLQATERQLQNFSEEQLKTILQKLQEIDQKLKTTSLPPKVLFSQLAVLL